jgi:hypothetical protein
MKIWTKEDDEMLLKYYANECAADIAERLGCSRPTLYRRAKRLGITGKKILKEWKPEDIIVLKISYGKAPAEELSRLLGRSQSAIYMQASILGLTNKYSKKRSTVKQPVNVKREWNGVTDTIGRETIILKPNCEYVEYQKCNEL